MLSAVIVRRTSISRGGRDDCLRHVSTKKHVEVAKLKTEYRSVGIFQTVRELGSYHDRNVLYTFSDEQLSAKLVEKFRAQLFKASLA